MSIDSADGVNLPPLVGKKQKHKWQEITVRVHTSPEKAHTLYEAIASMLTWHGKFGKKLVLSAEITSEGECPECDGTGKEFSGWDRATGDPCYWDDSACGGCSGTGWIREKLEVPQWFGHPFHSSS